MLLTFSASSALGYQGVIRCEFDTGSRVRRDFIHLFRAGAPWKISWPLHEVTTVSVGFRQHQ